MLFGIPAEFILFGAMLIGVALFYKRSLEIALAGIAVILVYVLTTNHISLRTHLAHRWPLLLNLLGLLIGFHVLAQHFAQSGAPQWLNKRLPRHWLGGFILLIMVACLSVFLDNIAAALIGSVLVKSRYQNNVRIGFLAAVVAASNAGGAGSVLGDTTTTMMWVAGVPAFAVAKAFMGAAVATLFSGLIASYQQRQLSILIPHDEPEIALDRVRLAIVVIIIVGAIATNLLAHFPALGVWIAILLGNLARPVPWRQTAQALKGAIFLITLVFGASLMPLSQLPAPSWLSTLGLGFVSAVFDNIPLTALALFQGNYDWGLLAYAVGYGGSILWFGSSAGVALSQHFPQARNSARWLTDGWHVVVAYIIGFFVMLAVAGWHPSALPRP